MSGAIQVCRFPCGGYCLHKITGNFAGRVSAWFKADGSMLAAEQILRVGASHSRTVKKGAAIWREVAAFGKAYVLPASEIGAS